MPQSAAYRWAEARVKIARMTLTIKLDGSWSSFQIANCAPPLGVTDSAIAPSARRLRALGAPRPKPEKKMCTFFSNPIGAQASLDTRAKGGSHTSSQNPQTSKRTAKLSHNWGAKPRKIERFTLMRPIHGNL